MVTTANSVDWIAHHLESGLLRVGTDVTKGELALISASIKVPLLPKDVSRLEQLQMMSLALLDCAQAIERCPMNEKAMKKAEGMAKELNRRATRLFKAAQQHREVVAQWNRLTSPPRNPEYDEGEED